jgi:hypothetical protein
MHMKMIPHHEQRYAENQPIVARHNHKQAHDNPDIIYKALTQDVFLGFACVIQIQAIQHITNAMVCQLGMVLSLTLACASQNDASLMTNHST